MKEVEISYKMADKLMDFFKTIYKEGETSPAETTNFLNTYVDFILKLNGIAPSKIEINLHETKSLGNNCEARTQESHKYYDLYDIYLDYNKYKLEERTYNSNNSKRRKKDNNKIFYKNKSGANNSVEFSEQIYKIMTLLSDLGHEMQHVIQLYTESIEADRRRTEFIELEAIQFSNDNKYTKEQRKIAKKQQIYLKCLSDVELEADNMSVAYFKALMSCIMQRESILTNNNEDADFVEFLKFCRDMIADEYESIDFNRKHLRADYKKFQDSARLKGNFNFQLI